ncbi:MAG: alpha amylase C-terminal domain-containing protein, partial [Methylobacter sp.]
NEKNNYANGEYNQDGCNNNLSFNCGTEGDTEDLSILALRRKQVKNVFAMLLLSHGVPMLLAGDELLNSQHGNNNCYCQDNELSWIDWNMTEHNADTLRFVQLMIALRTRHSSIMRRRFLTGKPANGRGIAEIQWHGTELNKPLWNDYEAKVLAFTLAGVESDEADLHVVINMSDHQINIELPLIPGRAWCRALDTSLKSPQDIVSPEEQQVMQGNHYSVNTRTIVVFENVVTG